MKPGSNARISYSNSRISVKYSGIRAMRTDASFWRLNTIYIVEIL